MPQLYIFIGATLAILGIFLRRLMIVRQEKKTRFEKELQTHVKEYKEAEKAEIGKRFRDSYMEQQGRQKFDLAKYNEEIRKAETAIAKKQWNAAKKSLIQALALSQDEMPVSLKLAKTYLESGDLKKAESIYRKLLEKDINNPEVYENLGKIFTKQKAYKEAVRAYARAVELDEKDDQKFLALGKLYFLLMRYSLAAECFRRAAELKPREVNYLFLLADACREDEDFENALFTYEKILTLEPYNEKAKGAAADVRVKIKEYESFFRQTKTT
ncbi:tetratricopeptide repeat protein [Candidatus Peregrinibacteria bacterium]|nr:tetratricopeptide repeat protein [Candidatus Peregrinibacteria bacterium]